MSFWYTCAQKKRYVFWCIALCMLADCDVARSCKIFPKRMNYLMAEGVLARIDGERSSLYSFLQSQAPEQSAVERKSKIMNGTNEERDLIGRREKLKQQEKSRAKWCQLSGRKELSIKEAWKSDIPSQSPFFFSSLGLPPLVLTALLLSIHCDSKEK